MWLVPRSARRNLVGVEPKGSKCNLKIKSEENQLKLLLRRVSSEIDSLSPT